MAASWASSTLYITGPTVLHSGAVPVSMHPAGSIHSIVLNKVHTFSQATLGASSSKRWRSCGRIPARSRCSVTDVRRVFNLASELAAARPLCVTVDAMGGRHSIQTILNNVHLYNHASHWASSSKRWPRAAASPPDHGARSQTSVVGPFEHRSWLLQGRSVSPLMPWAGGTPFKRFLNNVHLYNHSSHWASSSKRWPRAAASPPDHGARSQTFVVCPIEHRGWLLQGRSVSPLMQPAGGISFKRFSTTCSGTVMPVIGHDRHSRWRSRGRIPA